MVGPGVLSLDGLEAHVALFSCPKEKPAYRCAQ